MRQNTKGLTLGVLLMIGAATTSAQTTNGAVKIGVISDLSGPYSAQGGNGTVRAVEMAVRDFGGKVLGKPIEVVSVDYGGNVDRAATKTREWFDADNVDAVVESTDSAAAIAMGKIAAQKKKLIIYASAGTTVLTNAECSSYGIQYTYNAYALSNSVARAVTQGGDKSWYFITLDRAAGTSFEQVAANAVKAAGGEVIGSVRHPLNASDFASFLLRAQASKAQVIGLANFAVDTQNAIRQAAEFGINKSQKLVPLLIYDTDVKGLGLAAAQGMQFSTSFYWDRNKDTRDWSQRFFKLNNTMPTMIHAGAYSATMHYLQAIAAVRTDASDAVIKQMKATPIKDFFADNGTIREDGLMVHDMYLAQVQKPSESRGEWDVAKIIRTIPREEAFEPLSASTCPLLKH
ncbi:ABC transporter substrate-binding protein [Paraburkholderia xenovorans]|jgi:branched-chain amino acid transport system substrate-binding protein